MFGFKTIVSVRGLDWQRAKWGAFARGVLKFGEWTSSRCPTATVVVSETLQRHYEQEHGRRPHVIPNAVSPAVVLMARDVGGVVILQATLTFIGLGGNSPWGDMLSQGRNWIISADIIEDTENICCGMVAPHKRWFNFVCIHKLNSMVGYGG